MHNCPLLQTSNGNNSGNCWWNKITFQIERDKKERAAFVFQMHTNYLFSLAEHVVPWKGPEPRGSIVLDTRAMDEFIASLDAGKDALRSQSLHYPEEAAALPCPQTPSERGSTEMRKSFEVAQNCFLEGMRNIIHSDCSDRPPMLVLNCNRPKKTKCK